MGKLRALRRCDASFRNVLAFCTTGRATEVARSIQRLSSLVRASKTYGLYCSPPSPLRVTMNRPAAARAPNHTDTMKIVVADDLPESAIELPQRRNADGPSTPKSGSKRRRNWLRDLADADALLVRSATKVTTSLLGGRDPAPHRRPRRHRRRQHRRRGARAPRRARRQRARAPTASASPNTPAR